MKEQIAVGIILYNPENIVLSKIEQIVTAGLKTYIFDNSPDIALVREKYFNNKLCKYYNCGKNVGLGVALATLASQAYYAGYKAIIYFDQDTIFTGDTLNYIANYHSANELLLEKEYSAIVFSNDNVFNGKILKDVILARNSGSLYILNNLHKLGWHNTSYFVDGVDYEFCLKSLINGFKIGMIGKTPGFDHDLEQGAKSYKLLGRVLKVRKYPISRITDIMISYTKITMKSLKNCEGRFFLTIVRLWAEFLLLQIIIRICRPLPNKN